MKREEQLYQGAVGITSIGTGKKELKKKGEIEREEDFV